MKKENSLYTRLLLLSYGMEKKPLLEAIKKGLLKSQGVTFAMDDFSMGHTSLRYLRENLFDYVKLDGGLVKEMMNNNRSGEIIASIIQLGKKLQFKIVAEYVDDEKKASNAFESGL